MGEYSCEESIAFQAHYKLNIMDDWDNEDFEPLPVELAKEVPKAQWGDEDVEEVKTNCKVVEKPRTVGRKS